METARNRSLVGDTERKAARFRDELFASLGGLERTLARLRRHTIRFGLWGAVIGLTDIIMIVAELR